jgi:hypothetical protein
MALTGSEWRPYKRLAVAIVTAYVNDWIDANIMCESNGVLPKKLDEYRWQKDRAETFFKGKLCASCEAATGLSGDYILAQLKKGNATKIVHTLEVGDE